MVIDYLHNLVEGGGHPGENEMEALALGGLGGSWTARSRPTSFAPPVPLMS